MFRKRLFVFLLLIFVCFSFSLLLSCERAETTYLTAASVAMRAAQPSPNGSTRCFQLTLAVKLGNIYDGNVDQGSPANFPISCRCSREQGHLKGTDASTQG